MNWPQRVLHRKSYLVSRWMPLGLYNKNPSQQLYYTSFTGDGDTQANKETSKSTKVIDDLPVSSKEIELFLKDNVVVKEGHTNYITTCPRYALVKLNIAQVDKVCVNKRTGFMVCKSCNAMGPWQMFKDNVIKLVDLAQKRENLPEKCFPDEKHKNVPKKVETMWNTALPVESVDLKKLKSLQNVLGIDQLDLKTLSRFNIRVLPDISGLVIPLFNADNIIAGVRVVNVSNYSVKGQERKRIVSKTIPNIDCSGLFGLNHVNSESHELVLTGNEFDSMAVYQELGVCTVALPKGRTMLHQELLPSLEQFSKITVWMGGDQQSWEKAVSFTKKLNQERCFLIRPTKKKPNALQVLTQGLNMKAIIYGAKPVRHKSIVSFHNLRQEVFQEISDADKLAGIKWTRYPILNNLMKGHRRGELTVFTGPTGAGKTTFISDYSLDLCMQGVNTLWGSFEINNVKLLKTMLAQFAQKNLVKYLDEFDFWADKFEQLPLYFMNFHGQQNVGNVIETMSHAAYVYDIAHVIVDNLQFMMGTSNNNAQDRFLCQDQIISDFRKFATTMNCHVTLVIHPRKERDEELSVSSIFGSAKASQEADNILILQDKRLTSMQGRKYIQVAKNRFDGELGIMLLKFNKDTLSYSVLDKDKKKPNL